MHLLPRRAPGSGLPRLRLPSQCAVCHGWGTQRVCHACIDRYDTPLPRCARCALRVPSGVEVCGRCLREPPAFERALAVADYAYPWDALVTQFKFHAALDLAPVLAQALLRSVRRAGIPRPSCLLPMPLGARRLRERGYNQAWELARRLGPALGCDADTGLLLRTQDRPHQLALPHAARAENVRGVFTLAPRRADEVRGREITLVDDVMTTGATAAEAARTLLDAGAAGVQVWVIARTPAPQDA